MPGTLEHAPRLNFLIQVINFFLKAIFYSIDFSLSSIQSLGAGDLWFLQS